MPRRHWLRYSRDCTTCLACKADQCIAVAFSLCTCYHSRMRMVRRHRRHAAVRRRPMQEEGLCNSPSVNDPLRVLHCQLAAVSSMYICSARGKPQLAGALHSPPADTIYVHAIIASCTCYWLAVVRPVNRIIRHAGLQRCLYMVAAGTGC